MDSEDIDNVITAKNFTTDLRFMGFSLFIIRI